MSYKTRFYINDTMNSSKCKRNLSNFKGTYIKITNEGHVKYLYNIFFYNKRKTYIENTWLTFSFRLHRIIIKPIKLYVVVN